MIQRLRPRSQLQKCDRSSLIIHHRNTQDRLLYFQGFFFFLLHPCLLCMCPVYVWRTKRQHLKLGTASLPAARSFTFSSCGNDDWINWRVPVVPPTVSEVIYCWKKVLRQNFVKDETSFFSFCIAEFLNFLLSWLNFFSNLTLTPIGGIFSKWQYGKKPSKQVRMGGLNLTFDLSRSKRATENP